MDNPTATRPKLPRVTANEREVKAALGEGRKLFRREPPLFWLVDRCGLSRNTVKRYLALIQARETFEFRG